MAAFEPAVPPPLVEPKERLALLRSKIGAKYSELNAEVNSWPAEEFLGQSVSLCGCYLQCAHCEHHRWPTVCYNRCVLGVLDRGICSWAQEARVAVAVKQETVLRDFEREVGPLTTRVGSVPLDTLQFISDRRDDERHQQAVSSAQQHAEANATIRRLEAAALDRIREQNSETAKTIRGMEASVRSIHEVVCVCGRSLLLLLPALLPVLPVASKLSAHFGNSSARRSKPHTAS